jgi:hypothetical protein
MTRCRSSKPWFYFYVAVGATLERDNEHPSFVFVSINRSVGSMRIGMSKSIQIQIIIMMVVP